MSPIGDLVSGRPVNGHWVPGIVRTASSQAFDDPRRTIPCDFFVSQSAGWPSFSLPRAGDDCQVGRPLKLELAPDEKRVKSSARARSSTRCLPIDFMLFRKLIIPLAG